MNIKQSIVGVIVVIIGTVTFRIGVKSQSGHTSELIIDPQGSGLTGIVDSEVLREPNKIQDSRSMPDEIVDTGDAEIGDDNPQEKRDRELGLDLNQPINQIDMAGYIFRWDENSQVLDLTNRELAERYNRLVAFMTPNREYWDARIGVQLLERALAALQNKGESTGRLLDVVGAAVPYAKVSGYEMSGYIVDSRANTTPGRNTGMVVVSGRKVYYDTPDDAFPGFDAWAAFVMESNKSPVDRSEPPDHAVFSESGRLMLIDELASALAWRISVMPTPKVP